MNTRQVAIFNDAINKLYEENNIDYNDKYTWHNSKGLSYRDVFNKIVELSKDEEYYSKYNEHIDGLIDGLRVYLNNDGIKRNMFKERLSINQLKESRLIIFSFGMRGATLQTTDKRDLSLKQMTISYLSTLLANYNKTSLGVSTIIELEELQRYLRNKANSEEAVNIFTGSRKRNVVAIGAINDPAGLVKGVYNGSEAIIENTTTAFFGAMKKKTIEDVTSCLEMPYAEPYLQDIANSKEFKHCFLMCNDFKDFTVLRVEIPDELAKSAIYKTRNEFKGN